MNQIASRIKGKSFFLFLTICACIIILLGLYAILYDGNGCAQSTGDIFCAIWDGNVERVAKIIDNNPDLINIRSRRGYTPIMESFTWWFPYRGRRHTLSHDEQVEIEKTACALIKFFLDRGASINEPQNCPPLYLAMQPPVFMYDVAEMLLENGAMTDVLVQGEPLLFYAVCADVFSNCPSFFELLLKHGANINMLDKSGNTVLHLVIPLKWPVEVIKNILDTGIDISIKNDHGKTALDVANRWDRPDIVKLLQETEGVKETEGVRP